MSRSACTLSFFSLSAFHAKCVLFPSHKRRLRFVRAWTRGYWIRFWNFSFNKHNLCLFYSRKYPFSVIIIMRNNIKTDDSINSLYDVMPSKNYGGQLCYVYLLFLVKCVCVDNKKKTRKRFHENDWLFIANTISQNTTRARLCGLHRIYIAVFVYGERTTAAVVVRGGPTRRSKIVCPKDRRVTNVPDSVGRGQRALHTLYCRGFEYSLKN